MFSSSLRNDLPFPLFHYQMYFMFCPLFSPLRRCFLSSAFVFISYASLVFSFSCHGPRQFLSSSFRPISTLPLCLLMKCSHTSVSCSADSFYAEFTYMQLVLGSSYVGAQDMYQQSLMHSACPAYKGIFLRNEFGLESSHHCPQVAQTGEG